MKTTLNLKAFILLSTLTFGAALKAETINLPVITKPTILEEGTQRELTASQIEELLPWAKDSKVFLNDLLDGIQGLSSLDKHDRLIEGIKSVVGESAPKNSELLMRYVLNRGLVVDEILSNEMKDDEVGTIDAKNRVLISSVKMAIKYYELDMAVLSKKNKTAFAVFGADFFEFLNELNKSIFDASAQYNILRTSLEWLQWDLYRDLNNASFASHIVKINNSLKIYPNKKMTDAQSIAFIRQMKGVSQQLKIKEATAKLESDLRLRAAADEQERQRIMKEQQEAEEIRRTQAAEAEEMRKYGQGGIIQTVQSFNLPSVNGVYFSTASNVDGVCKVLGFQKAAGANITNNGNVRGALLVVEANGEIKSAEMATDRNGYAIAQMTCLNKVLGRPTPKIEKVTNFATLGGVVSSQSSENGICKALGYESGVKGSGTADGSARGSMAIVDNNAKASTGEIASDRQGYKFSSVVCINKVSQPTLNLVHVNAPKYQGNILSTNSNISGVCRILGYRGGLEGSQSSDSSARGSMLVVDVTGSIVNTEIATDRAGYSISNMICVK